MKYVITDETKTLDGVTLHRIRATSDFNSVKSGDLGGWVETDRNLSQNGICWLFDESVAMGTSRVTDEAQMRDRAVAVNSLIGNASAVSNDAVVTDSTVGSVAQIIETAVVKEMKIDFPCIISRSVTESVIYIDGLEYCITIMNEHIRLGSWVCSWTPTHDQFAIVTDRELLAVDNRRAVGFYKSNRKWLTDLCRLHASRVRTREFGTRLS